MQKFSSTKLILPTTKNLVPRQYYYYMVCYTSLLSYLVDCYSVAVCFYWRKLFSSVQLNIYYVAESGVVEPMYCGRIGTIHKCPDYQVVLIIQLSLHAKATFMTITKSVYADYAGVLNFKCPH